ncbi:MAG: metal ABC transporter permease [Deltaproteobacteria bacterium]|nr:metal ABC transporter permease [Deltaproteobacteria bacterium]
MTVPFLECLILVAIHTYLGTHVLRRRVIFVDLALAQTAALGTTVGFVFGIMPDSLASLIFSLVFTAIAAAIFSITRIRGERVPQEAVIGLFYAIMASTAILVVQKTNGAEHVEDILVGSLLWVQWQDVAVAASVYSFIGLFHFVFRERFLLISENPEKAFNSGIAVRFWDFLFYLSFGFVISFSVRVAGVLLVFVFLVAPAIMAFMISDRLRDQLLIGWTMGTIVTVLGLYLSYSMDLPSGPTVVVFYGIVLAAGASMLYLLRAKSKFSALVRFASTSAVIIVTAIAVFQFGLLLSRTGLARSQERIDALAAMESEARAQEEKLNNFKRYRLSELREKFDETVPISTIDEFAGLHDEEERFAFIQKTSDRKPLVGVRLLIYYLSDEETPLFYRVEALDLLRDKTGQDFGYIPELDVRQNQEAIARMREHILSDSKKRK